MDDSRRHFVEVESSFEGRIKISMGSLSMTGLWIGFHSLWC